MASFASQSWTSRFNKLGDEAESKWEEVAHEYVGTGPGGEPCSVRAGLCRPPFPVQSLEASERLRPDFLTPIGWIEVKGVGRDQLLKIKLESLVELTVRNRTTPAHIFVWDSHKKRHTLMSLDVLLRYIDEGKATLGFFPEPKAYFAVPCEHVFAAAPTKVRRRTKRAIQRCRRVPKVSASWTPRQDFAGGDDSGIPLFRQFLPESELQALMETAPHETPRPTKQFMQERDTKFKEAIAVGMNQLDPVKRIIVRLFFWEGMGAHTVEAELKRLKSVGAYDGPVGHSHVQRLYAEAITELRQTITNPYEQQPRTEATDGDTDDMG